MNYLKAPVSYQQDESFEALRDLPSSLLESFLPGFAILRRVFIAALGLDITILVSLVVILAVSFKSVNYILNAVSNHVLLTCTATVVVSSTDTLYEEIMKWLSNHSVGQESRRLAAANVIARGRFKFENPLFNDVNGACEQSDTDPNRKSSGTPEYRPAVGSHWFWHNRKLFMLRRTQKRPERDESGSRTLRSKEDLEITCFGRSPKPVKDLIEDCKAYVRRWERMYMSIYQIDPRCGRDEPAFWSRARDKPSRPMDTVFIPEEQKAMLVEDAGEYLHPASIYFYAQRGIPYRRGYLFHGPAGTGKTTTATTMAAHFGLNLYYVNISEPGMNDRRLSDLLSCVAPRCIVLLEDIDCAQVTQKRKAQKTPTNTGEKTEPQGRQPFQYYSTCSSANTEPVTLSGLLNAIDGVAATEGRLLVMTTNNPESLDEALVRPGRIDMKVAFGLITKDVARAMFERFYSVEDTSSKIGGVARLQSQDANGDSCSTFAVTDKDCDNSTKIEQLAATFAETLPDQKLTPAQVQGYLLANKKHPKAAVDKFGAWCELMSLSQESEPKRASVPFDWDDNFRGI